MISVNKNRITWDNLELEFNEDIKEIACLNNKLIVLFEANNTKAYDNVICINQDGNFSWRVKDVPEKIGGSANAIYVGISIDGTNCWLVDFYGRSFLVDTNDGSIISMRIVK